MSRDFRADERGLGFEICGAMACPYLKLSVMVGKRRQMLLSSPRKKPNSRRQHVPGRRRSETRPSRFAMPQARATNALVAKRRPRPRSLRQRSEPEAFVSGNRIRKTPEPGCLPEAALTQVRQNPHRSKTQTHGSIREASGRGRVAQQRPRSQARNRVRLANSRAFSASVCTSARLLPTTREFLINSAKLYAANVRSPIRYAASKARRTNSRPVATCFVHGMTKLPNDM